MQDSFEVTTPSKGTDIVFVWVSCSQIGAEVCRIPHSALVMSIMPRSGAEGEVSCARLSKASKCSPSNPTSLCITTWHRCLLPGSSRGYRALVECQPSRRVVRPIPVLNVSRRPQYYIMRDASRTLHSKSSYPAKSNRPDTEKATEVMPHTGSPICSISALAQHCTSSMNTYSIALKLAVGANVE